MELEFQAVGCHVGPGERMQVGGVRPSLLSVGEESSPYLGWPGLGVTRPTLALDRGASSLMEVLADKGQGVLAKGGPVCVCV